VADVTGIPEVLEGRVKTLHPAIHAGILARRSHEEDMAALDEHGYAPIDLVVGNLYPFGAAAQDRNNDLDDMLEYIDIGGPTMLRAAAKNHPDVGVVIGAHQYDRVADELEQNEGHLSLPTRRGLAQSAFAHTAAYDQLISDQLSRQPEFEDAADDESLPFTFETSMMQDRELRYGENPHQNGALYGTPWRFFDKIHGQDLSYNNLLDASNALALIDEFRDAGPTCAILKHTNPCGVATAETLEAAWHQAFATDTQSPYGGIVVVNQALDRTTAEAIDEIFTEIVIAPEFESGVLDLLSERERRCVVRHDRAHREGDRLDVRSVLGGLLVQTRDPVLPSAADMQDRWEVPTARSPTDDERGDLDFAWRVAKHVKSNAIVYARDRATLGIGAGQMSRIDASELAVFKAQKSELDLTGSVVASDAFFPFADGLEAAAREGARAAIQPGGSIRDEEVIEAADDHDIAMIFTGRRHFRH
jgi:phosphoribosylaminoimidazolecarboxamide formyltransferase/IMP cyclohydrolase